MRTHDIYERFFSFLHKSQTQKKLHRIMWEGCYKNTKKIVDMSVVII